MNRYILTASVLLMLSGLALGAGEGVERYYNWHDLGWRIANFAVFFAIVIYLVRKYAIGILDRYRDGVGNRIDSSYSDLESTQTEVDKYRSEIEGLSARLDELKGEATLEAKKKYETVIKDAHQRADDIEKKFEVELKAALDSMRKEIMGEIFEDAVKLAITKLQGNLSEKDARDFTAKSIQSIENSKTVNNGNNHDKRGDL